MNLAQDFPIQIKTFFGLEPFLAKEILSLGGRDVEIKNRAVTCIGDLGFLYKINYASRLAVKILVPVAQFKSTHPEHLYNRLRKLPWQEFLPAGSTFAIDSTIYSTIFTHSHYVTLKMKDAVMDYFAAEGMQRPQVDTSSPDIKFHLHIEQDWVTISLDSSGDPLFKRGYRKQAGAAPINEVLASGMLAIAGWDGKGNFLDPMCGSGTLLIEAAMVAMDLPAQLFRKQFGFQNWDNYDASLFSTIKEYRLNRIKQCPGVIRGLDKDPEMVRVARENIAAAELEDVIDVQCVDFFDTEKDLFPLLMVFNPPYDERLPVEQDDFYKKIGDTFKAKYPNTLAWLISADLEAPKKIGLRPSRKVKLFNGNLETRFLQYEMYEGSRKTVKQN